MNNINSFLRDVRDNNYKVPEGTDISQVVHEMIQHIGSIDDELRDKLIYGTLHRWIMNQELSIELVRQVLYVTLDDDHLFYGIGDNDQDTVFTRSFSALFIALALHYNDILNYLTENEYEYIYSRVTLYFELEKDFRGYILDKGWAHSIAHAADVLGFISASSYYSQKHLLVILELIGEKACVSNYYFINDEDERMAEVVIQIVKRNILKKDILINWVQQIGSIERLESYPEDDIIRGNTKNLLRSVYFKLLNISGSEVITKEILKTLNQL
ncbi:Protein of unknown function [Paenibacillus uliginis N3/975]|uniref:DUF2785 domain-containing protein n=1 Tax=Paenibacillus uliginis N3/975 TaxID=1313296 RepID=A0A1X7H3F7_9BACL|nr:DUF2785 domain-containing protein [Paenibacillus uliginis]SMF78892.1 Protein of unknown function [Paenibacillus uliginis N3/975]